MRFGVFCMRQLHYKTQLKTIIATGMFVVYAHAVGQTLTSPIAIESGLSPSDSASSKVILRNSGSKKITGYILKIEDFDSAGKGTFRASEVRVFGLAGSKLSNGKLPGEQWTHKAKVFNKTGTVPSKLSIDYVVFDDDSRWGPNSLGQGAKISGIREGWRAAEALNKRILQDEGADGLARHLNSVK